jgi:diguanylate cyclase (GGDEF)-like protein/PAS domain S-box-containing protein
VEEALFVEKERAQVTLNCIGDAVVCTDISGNITSLNLMAEKMTGWLRQEAAGLPMAEVFRIMDATSREIIANLMDRAVDQNRTVHLPPNCILLRRDGFEIPIEDSVAPIRDRQGQPTGAVIVFRDVSAARAMAVELAHSAEHDFLTGLPNRMLLNDRVSQSIAFAQRHAKKVALLFLDLDGFKHINDSLGHPVGDKLLQSVAKRLADCVRGSDTVSRQGGDEFVVLLSEVEHSEDAAITARRMLRVVAKPHSIDEHDLFVTASIGLSIYPDDGHDAETLIKNADTAMYQAKEDGRQSYQFFEPAMNVRAVERQFIEEGLRRALERQEFTLHYQPKINLRTGDITGAEALLRWTHPSLGAVSPARFIPVAEDCGLILPIGQWVLREACQQARAWVDAGLPLTTMAVNISAMEFRDAHFLEGVCAILEDTGLDPTSLVLELTESVLMKHVDSTESILKTLRARGVQVAVDDFGTGYSSLSYLRKFPIDALKIDQSFVRQITSAPRDTTIVTAVISMGRSLNLRVVAEGVEMQEELTFLQAHQCDEAQGYYFSQPVVAQQFAKLLETGISQTVLH